MSVITIMEEEVYDSLSQAQKNVMLRNGIFEFEFDAKQSSRYCCCNHSIMEHLDCVDCCLSKELCICDRFLDEKSKLVIPQKQSKLPYKKEEQKQKEQIEDKQLDSYIQTLAKM